MTITETPARYINKKTGKEVLAMIAHGAVQYYSIKDGRPFGPIRVATVEAFTKNYREA